MQENRAVVTVIGGDRIGIVAAISRVLAEHGANIEDIRMATLRDLFTMVALVDLSGLTGAFAALKAQLEEEGRALGLQVLIQRLEVFQAMHRI